jgi:hypothetical protein
MCLTHDFRRTPKIRIARIPQLKPAEQSATSVSLVVASLAPVLALGFAIAAVALREIDDIYILPCMA